MPRLSSKQKKSSRGREEKSKRTAPKFSKKRREEELPEEPLVEDALPEEVEAELGEEEQQRVVPAHTVEKAEPFIDGLVATSLKDLFVVPHAVGADVELIRGFLNYFSSTETFVGSMASKLSFMKKKGGTLL